MNYRHIYHAGNFADVFKHIILTRIILHLQKKDKAFRVYDTHAGLGLYDLSCVEAQKTGEWQNGVAKLLASDIPSDIQPLIEPYLNCLSAHIDEKNHLKTYPGSPKIARQLLRKQDRLSLYELHEADFITLKGNFESDFQTKLTYLDGYLALGAHVPPKEKRGLVLIDPPFEKTDEFERLGAQLTVALKRWQGGTYAVWYPAKDLKARDKLLADLRNAGAKDMIDMGISIAAQKSDGALFSTGMIVINPPYTLYDEAEKLLPYLAKICAKQNPTHWNTKIEA